MAWQAEAWKADQARRERYLREYRKKKALWCQQRVARGKCHSMDDALLLLKAGHNLDKANTFLSGKVRPREPRTLDLQIYYVILAMKDSGLSPEARRYLEGLCNKHYNEKLPPYVSLDRKFDPWDYQLCGCPTENHLFNDTCNRLAECVIFPDRVFSDGHTAAEYRPYWENAFQQLAVSRITHGMREWHASIYIHVVFDDVMMVYSIMPEGPTREAARLMLDLMFLNMAVCLRNDIWMGPHSRVYNDTSAPWPSVYNQTAQCYSKYAGCLLGKSFLAPIASGDYVLPEAIAHLPFREDRYVSIEKVGPRFYPRGSDRDRFNPGPVNIYICQSDREDWGGDGLIYNYLAPKFCLGSVQDWGNYDGEWHMHCVPWTFGIASADKTDVVLSFTGSEQDSLPTQGGYMTWATEVNDQNATIFQHRKTLFSQMRGYRHEKVWENLPGGFPEAPWAPASGLKKLAGYRGEKVLFFSRFYIAHSIGKLIEEKGWLFGEKEGVCFAIRPVRGGYKKEMPQSKFILGKVFVCNI